MKKDLMKILACPAWIGDLEVRTEEKEGDEVVTGSLTCSFCSETYGIEDRGPKLLPPDLIRGSV